MHVPQDFQDGVGLPDVAGHGAEEVREALAVGQRRRGRRVADLRNLEDPQQAGHLAVAEIAEIHYGVVRVLRSSFAFSRPISRRFVFVCFFFFQSQPFRLLLGGLPPPPRLPGFTA